MFDVSCPEEVEQTPAQLPHRLPKTVEEGDRVDAELGEAWNRLTPEQRFGDPCLRVLLGGIGDEAGMEYVGMVGKSSRDVRQDRPGL